MADKTKTININGNPYTVGEENMWELPDMTDTVFAATISALNQVIFDTKNRIIEITGEIDSIDEIQHNFGLIKMYLSHLSNLIIHLFRIVI